MFDLRSIPRGRKRDLENKKGAYLFFWLKLRERKRYIS